MKTGWAYLYVLRYVISNKSPPFKKSCGSRCESTCSIAISKYGCLMTLLCNLACFMSPPLSKKRFRSEETEVSQGLELQGEVQGLHSLCDTISSSGDLMKVSV